jgi:hypothetical protein
MCLVTDIDVIDFTAAEAAKIGTRFGDPSKRALIQSPEYLSFLEHAGPGFILRVDGSPIGAVVFCRILFDGVAETVVLACEELAKYGRIVHRICKKSFDSVQREIGFRRLQAWIPENAKRDRRWAESLGFRPEGTAEAMGPNGENWVLYARIRKG